VDKKSFKICSRCKEKKPTVAFRWQKDTRYKAGGCWSSSCKPCLGRRYRDNVKADPVRYARHKAYQAAYYKKNPWKARVKAYQHVDRQKARKSLTMTEGCGLILSNPCFYCGEADQFKLGLDRMDNDLGHSVDNVKVCCEICNNILTDLPFRAKVVVGEGLKKARELGLLEGYIIKTKRNRTAQITELA